MSRKTMGNVSFQILHPKHPKSEKNTLKKVSNDLAGEKQRGYFILFFNTLKLIEVILENIKNC